MVVGDRFVLRIREDQLTLTFVNDRKTHLSGVSLENAERAWAVGGRAQHGEPPENVVWRYDQGHWTESRLGLSDARNWQVTRIAALPSHDPFLVGFRLSGGSLSSTLASLTTHGPRFESLNAVAGASAVVEICRGATGVPWGIGWKKSAPNALRRPLLVEKRSDEWVDLSPERTDDGADAYFVAVSCWSDGAVAVGIEDSMSSAGTEASFLMRYEGGVWFRLSWPERIRHMQPVAVAARSGTDIWIAAACVGSAERCAPTTFHFDGTAWHEKPLPRLPGERGREYVLQAMVFPTPEVGWVIANDVIGSELSRGLIFTYEDGAWRNRNWDWHWWDESWWGLFGR